MNKQTVVISIPTRNSMATLPQTIDSIRAQSYQDYEIVIIDSDSTDGTVEYAEKQSIKVFEYPGKLLGARIEGLRKTGGDFHLLLDSDQILESTAVERCIQAMSSYDMICMEERSYQPHTFLERLFEADRMLLHSNPDRYLDPMYGVMSPRFYRRNVLKKAFEGIPEDIVPELLAYEDAIIYYEARKYSEQIGIVPNCLWHQEPKGLLTLMNKNIRYGKSVRKMHDRKCYTMLIENKSRPRSICREQLDLSVKANLLLLLKGLPFKFGYLIG